MSCARLAAMFALAAGLIAPAQASLRPETVGARLVLGHDSNLLDASDAERLAFDTGDAGSFFVVSAMEDEFVEGAIDGEWRMWHLWGRRPSLKFRYGRKQYLHNPIRSEDRYDLQARARVGDRTRVKLEAAVRPQVYGRHRFDESAGPGEPQFRPEVHRRWDLGLGLSRGIAAGTELAMDLEGSWRAYRDPFDARDRRAAGIRSGVVQAAGEHLRVALLGGYRRTWSQHALDGHSDLSNREWSLASWLEARSPRLVSAIRVEVELGWRRYTTGDPEDESHFGRDDRKTDLEVQVTRTLPGSLAWVSSIARRWRVADRPVGLDDDDAFSESVMRSGVTWSWDPEAKQ